MPFIDRKAFLKSLAATSLAVANPLSFATRSAQAQTRRNLLAPGRVVEPLVPGSAKPQKYSDHFKGTVSYWDNERSGKPILLYFHGFGGDYRAALPVEYPLLDEFRVILVHRPGYGGTDVSWQINGYDIKEPGAVVTARIAGRLLGDILGSGDWGVSVIGTSGGGPAALAFADRFAPRTRAVVLQAAVTFPWWYEDYIANIFLQSYRVAVTKVDTDHPGLQQKDLQEFSRLVTKAFAPLAVKAALDYIKDNHNFIRPLIGDRLPEVMDDDAAAAVLNLEAGGFDTAASAGMGNDFVSLFRSTDPFCDWNAIKAPTLIIHDAKDPFVKVFHANQAAARLSNHILRTAYRLGGHMIWLGADSRAMHEERKAFILAHQ